LQPVPPAALAQSVTEARRSALPIPDFRECARRYSKPVRVQATVPAASHGMHVRNPDAYNEAVPDFLGRPRRAGR
jgi:pimeloyl-ACP methyl ester carboxylesterase